jgi:ubiquinone/menaquinone biosynthesis C-methylase UbiE
MRINPKIKSVMRRTYYFVVDTIDLLLGRRGELTPSKRIRGFVGDGDFRKIGEEFLQYLIELGRLKPNARVLDVGCGIGRMAVPLTRYLDKGGSYEGFDMVIDGINWCRKKIAPKYPNFHFQLVDIYNKVYNPKGKCKASEYKFPYENESFDFIFLTSVFTHMLPQDMENYFSEIARVLKKDGRCLITFFLLNTESSKLIDAKLSLLDFKYKFEGCRTIDKSTPESAIAYDERFIRVLYKKYRLNIVEPIHYGFWCGRKKFLSKQDIVIAVKNPKMESAEKA